MAGWGAGEVIFFHMPIHLWGISQDILLVNQINRHLKNGRKSWTEESSRTVLVVDMTASLLILRLRHLKWTAPSVCWYFVNPTLLVAVDPTFAGRALNMLKLMGGVAPFATLPITCWCM